MSATTVGHNINVLFFGPPGAGKGTQADLVAPQLQVAHVSTGDLFRQNMREGTPLGLQIKPIYDAGGYVPDSTTIAMLDQHLQRLRRTQPELRGVIFDGFPRTPEQVAALDTLLGARAEQVNGVVYLTVPLDVLLPRLLARGRADDSADTITTRFTKYESDTAPLLTEYERRGTPVYRIDGNRSVEQVTAAVVAALQPLFAGRGG